MFRLTNNFFALLMGFYFLCPNFILSGQCLQRREAGPSARAFVLTDNPYKYSDYYRDPESRLFYLKARCYSPKLERFISRDTYDLSNRYAYCDENPISNIDPSGHNSAVFVSAATSTVMAFALLLSSSPALSGFFPVLMGLVNLGASAYGSAQATVDNTINDSRGDFSLNRSNLPMFCAYALDAVVNASILFVNFRLLATARCSSPEAAKQIELSLKRGDSKHKLKQATKSLDTFSHRANKDDTWIATYSATKAAALRCNEIPAIKNEIYRVQINERILPSPLQRSLRYNTGTNTHNIGYYACLIYKLNPAIPLVGALVDYLVQNNS